MAMKKESIIKNSDFDKDVKSDTGLKRPLKQLLKKSKMSENTK